MGLLDGIEVFTLEVLDERHLERHLFRHVADDHWHAIEAGSLRGAPAALTGDELVTIGDPSNDERLYDPARTNRTGEFVQRFLAEACAWLVRAWIDQVNINLKEAFTQSWCRCGRRCSRRRRHSNWRGLGRLRRLLHWRLRRLEGLSWCRLRLPN